MFPASGNAIVVRSITGLRTVLNLQDYRGKDATYFGAVDAISYESLIAITLANQDTLQIYHPLVVVIGTLS
jgi:hypothetical protein